MQRRARLRGLVPLLLFVASFGGTLVWLQYGPPASVSLHAAQDLDSGAETKRTFTASTSPSQILPIDTAVHHPPAKPLPTELVDELTEAGISADDSEQRSLAILELARAPVEQSLPSLLRILRENGDTRSRLTALTALMQLPNTQAVRESRSRLLKELARDQDYRVVEAARIAAGGEG